MSTVRASIHEEYPVIAPVVLSASRSTDIPARHAKWFVERLREGWFGWVNPFNQKRYAVSLENTRAIVFWTKHAAPLISYLDEIEERGFHFYFQYTLNDYEAEGLEPKIPSLDRRIETFLELSRKIGPARVIWRFDPILLHEGQTARDILHKIWNLSKKLRGATDRLVVSFADVNVGEVDALREAGGYFALFCGHDHKNSFVGHVHGIDLGYAPTCGFECYGPKSRFRGIRLFEFREDNPMAYVTRMLTWGDLVGRYSSNELRVFFEDHCVTDLIGVRNELRRPQVSATLLGAGAVACGAIGYAVRGLLRKSQ